MLILSKEQINMCEKAAESIGISYEKMMLNAGNGCAAYILKEYPYIKNAVILCGKGKNGGDGYVIANALINAGKNVTAVNVFGCESDALSQKMKDMLPHSVYTPCYTSQKNEVESIIAGCDILIDAIFGIGFSGALTDGIKELIGFCNTLTCVKIAIDIPSGLSCNVTESITCLVPDKTLCMLALKPETAYKPWSMYCGQVKVIDIGFKAEPDGAKTLADKNYIKGLIKQRPFDANKGSFGKTLIIAGSVNMPGAAIIAASGAIGSGAGLVTLAFPDVIYSAVTAQLSECLFMPLKTANGFISSEEAANIVEICNKYSSVAFGCGVGVNENTMAILEALLKSYKGTLIIDADGINLLAANIDILKEAKCKICLTPHPGEMSRITGKSISEINSDRDNTALMFAKEYSAYVALKGTNTVICSPDGKIIVNPTGCTALSRGGSGDLLTGIAASFAAQGLSAADTLAAAAYIHGLSGDIAAQKYSEAASTVKLITGCLPDAFLQLK